MPRPPTSGYHWWESWLYARFALPTMRAYHHRLLAQIIAEAPQGGRCLDIGCGNGTFLCALAKERPDLILCGLDASRSALREARRHRVPSDLQFLQGLAEELPFSDGMFDVVVATGVIKHCHPPAQALAEMHRVLRHQGQLILHEMDPLVSDERFSGLVTAFPAITKSIIRRWVLPKSLTADTVRGFVSHASWQVVCDAALPDLPLYSFILRRT